MSSNNFKKSFFFKLLSIFVAFTFSFQNISFAFTQKDVKSPRITEAEKLLSVDDIGIAIDAGEIKSKYTGDSGKVIVHIQDAHCNYEAQSNINKILEQVTKECGIDMISVEGAEGIVDTSWFRAFPDAEIRKEVATYFMKKGEIAGAEFFSINSDYEGTIFGAETRDYYVRNLKAFTEVYPYKDSIEKYFQNIRTIANRLKSMIYPPKLKEVDAKIRAFDAKEIELSEFSDYLRKTASRNDVNIEDCPNLKKLLDTLEYEGKIDFDIVDQERSQYIDALSKKMSKENMTELVAQSIKFKKGHVKAVDFYTHLRNLAKEYGIAIVTDYSNLFYYYIYTKLYDGIDNESLFKEIDLTERRLKEKLFTSSDQEKLDRYSSMVNMFIDLINIELTNEDYDLFQSYTKDASLEDAVSFVESLCSRYNLNYSIGGVPSEISENIPKMIDFYEIAMERDKVLIENTIKEMSKEKKDKCILIAGGFHTRGIRALLEKQGISYVVVTPKITKDVETPYIKVLTNQRTSIEDIITESTGFTDNTAAHHSMLNERPAPSEKLLNPVLRIFTAETFFTDDREWKKIKEDLPKEAIERIDEIVKEAQEKDIEIWHRDNKGKGADEYLKQVYTQLENSKPDTKDRKVLKKWEKAIKGIYDKLKPVIEEKFKFKRATPGKREIGPYTGLTLEQAKALDVLIRQSIKGKTYIKKKIKLKYGKIFTFIVHFGLKDRIEKHNVEVTKTGKGIIIPLELHIHPGRGGEEKAHKLLQGHIDSFEFLNMTLSDMQISAEHETWHLDIFNIEHMPEQKRERERINKTHAYQRWEAWTRHKKTGSVEEEEIFVDSIPESDTVASGIRKKLNNFENIRKAGRYAAIKNNNIEAMQAFLMADVEFGTGVRDKIKRLKADMEPDSKINKFTKEMFIKRYNIDLARTALTRRPYQGYDNIMILASTKDEALYKKRDLEKDSKGLPVKIFSEVVADEGGQIIGIVTGLESAERKHKNVRDILKANKQKMGIFPDGGMAERFGPIVYGLSDARGSQDTVGTYSDANTNTVDAELFPMVVLNSLDFAKSNDGTSTDVFWTSQLIAGTVNHEELQRIKAPYAKLIVPIDWTVPQDVLYEQLFQFGTVGTDASWYIKGFAGNQKNGPIMKTEKGYALNMEHKYIYDDLKRYSETGHAGLDYGSFSMNNEMLLALWDYWIKKEDENGILIIDNFVKTGEFDKNWKRDIDPHFTQPLTFLLKATVEDPEILNGIPAAKVLGNYKGDEREAMLNKFAFLVKQRLPLNSLLRLGEITIEQFESITPATSQEDIAKLIKDVPYVTETIEIFLLNRDNENIFGDLTKVVGAISLGENAEWQTFRSALNITNEKLFMLAALSGKVVELQRTGEVTERKVTEEERICAEDALMRKNIDLSKICDFHVNGKHIVLSSDEVFGPEAWRGEGLIIHRSIIQGGNELLPGSEIIDSVVDKSEGMIVAQYAYVQKNTVTDLTIENGMAHMFVSDKPISVNGKIGTDIFRPQINDTREGFMPGHTRAQVDAGYDPKISDKEKAWDNLYALGKVDEATGEIGIRGMECVRSENEAIEEKARERVRKVIAEKRMELRAKRALIEAQVVFEREAHERGFDKKVSDTALTRLRQWLTEEGFSKYRERLFDLIWKAGEEQSSANELFEAFAYDTPFYLSVDYELMKEGIGPYRKNDITFTQTEHEKEEVEKLLNELEEAGLPRYIEERLEHLYDWLVENPQLTETIEGYAKDNGLSKIKATAELRYLSSVKRELSKGEDRLDKFAGIEMVDILVNGVFVPIVRSVDTGLAKNDVTLVQERFERYAYCEKTFKKAKMGTSGLRAPAVELTDMEVNINTRGVLAYLIDLPNRTDLPEKLSAFIKKGAIKKGDYVAVAGDLRNSTDRIAEATALAILESGNKVDYIGKVATPVGALYGLIYDMAFAMITGSHIPKDDNGEKFYRANGELWKEEERILFQYIEKARKEEYLKTWAESKYDKEGILKADEELTPEQLEIVKSARKTVSKEMANRRAMDAGQKPALELYEERLLKAFGRSLRGIKFAFWEQTTVDRDYSPNRLRGMGADVVIVGRMDETEDFLTLDTEDVKEAYLKMAEKFMDETGRDVLITKDGDSDRPGVFIRRKDGKVVFIPGDKLNVLAAFLLRPKRFSIPKTANYVAMQVLTDNGIEVDYNNVGSPYIDVSMMEYLGFDGSNATGAYGCEVNGGGFIGDKEFSLPQDVVEKLRQFDNEAVVPYEDITGKLSRLSTRDAAVPIISAFLLAKINGKTLPELYEETFSGKYRAETGAVLVENVAGKAPTPGCEEYTKEMGPAIVETFMPKDKSIEEVSVAEDETGEIKTIAARLERYLTQIPGLENEKIVKLVFRAKGKSVGVHCYFGNGERIVLRPSGNAAQFRGYVLAKTLERVKEIAEVLERPDTGILVQLIQDYIRSSVVAKESTKPTFEIPTPGIYAATPAGVKKGDFGVLVDFAVLLARLVKRGEKSPSTVIKQLKVFLPVSVSREGQDMVIPFTRTVMQSGKAEAIYNATREELASALRLVQIASLIENLVPTKPYFTRYEWAGKGNQVQYNLSAPGQNEFNVAEAWHGITIKSKRNPDADSVIPGTAIIGKDGKIAVPDITLRELVNIAPEVFLGKGHKSKPFFIKFLSTRFADKVHEGFNENILEVGQETYTEWLIKERKNTEELLKSLRDDLTKTEFDEYRNFYEEWANIQADNGWKIDSLDKRVVVFVVRVKSYLKSDVNAFNLLDKIAKQRAEIVSVLNEIKLTDGGVVLSPTGTPHGIFGLSLQVHPINVQKNEQDEMEYPKNEAWIVKSVFDENREEHKILIEPQQTSDTTFSIADFFTPIRWDGRPKMRKDVTEKQLKYFIETSMEFKVTPSDKIILEPKDITPSEGVRNSRLESLINETSSVWPTKYFIVEKIILEGKGQENKASIAMPGIQKHAHDLLVLEGTVMVKRESGKETILTTGMSLPLDAKEGAYTIESEGKAEVLRVYPEEESYVGVETRSEDKITGEDIVQYIPEEEQEDEERMKVGSPLETDSFHITTGVVGEKTGMSQKIEISEAGKKVNVPFIINSRSHVLSAEMGDSSVWFGSEKITDLKEGMVLTISKDLMVDLYGKPFPVPGKTAVEYTLKKESNGPVRVKVSYDNTEEEKDVCSVWKELTDFRGRITENRYAFIAPKAMYVDGEGPGSKKWEKDTLNKYLYSDDCFNISVYNAETGLFSVDDRGQISGDVIVAIENAVKSGRIPLLAATQKLFDDASKNEKFREFLETNGVRIVPPIPKLDELGTQGWFFTREVEGKAILQGLLTVKSIAQKDSLARKLRRVISQSLRRNFEFNELYYLVAFGDTEAVAAIGQKTPLEWMLYMIHTMLQRMPVRPYDAYKDLENQRQTMYSV
ncbi:MAG: hypothetical protein ABH844_02910 [Candidatus Omnitrophota bacterium]